MTDPDRWRCEACDRVYYDRDLLRAPSPFDPEDTICGCPNCKQTSDGFRLLCDEAGCKNEVSGGHPTPQGYRRTCYDHAPRDNP